MPASKRTAKASTRKRAKSKPASRTARAPTRKAATPARRPAPKAARPGKRAARTSRAQAQDRPDKGEGQAAVRAYLTMLAAWQRRVAERIDAIVRREVPDAALAVKWGAAFYGVPGKGWFASVKAFGKVVKMTFFAGTSLNPVPPSGTHKDGRALDVREGGSFDEDQVGRWVKQAAKLPGWGNI